MIDVNPQCFWSNRPTTSQKSTVQHQRFPHPAFESPLVGIRSMLKGLYSVDIFATHSSTRRLYLFFAAMTISLACFYNAISMYTNVSS